MVKIIKYSKIYKFFVLQVTTFSLKFVETVFNGNVFVVSIIPSHVINESSIIFMKYLPFLQLRVAGFQI